MDNFPMNAMGNQSMLSAVQNATLVLSRIASTLSASFPQVSGTASSATAGAATLPANPVGFLSVTLPNGTAAMVPYYSP